MAFILINALYLQKPFKIHLTKQKMTRKINKAFYGGFRSGFSVIKFSQKTTWWQIFMSTCRIFLSCHNDVFPYTSAECSLFQSKTIYFADSLKVTVNRPILSKNRLIPCKMNWYTHVFRSFHNFFKSKESFWNNPNKTIV